MDITGIIKLAFETKIASETFKSREFVLTTDHKTQYPQHVTFQLTQESVNLIDQFEDGEEVKVHFNLRGREWNGPQGIKYFNTLQAWRIESADPAKIVNKRAASKTTTTTPAVNTNTANAQGATDDNEDLPF